MVRPVQYLPAVALKMADEKLIIIGAYAAVLPRFEAFTYPKGVQ